MLKKYSSLRWILLGTGIIAILGLTAMNVYSLYALHERTIESDLENKKLQISEFTDKVHHRFYAPFWGIGSLDMNRVEATYKEKGHFPEEFGELLDKAASDSIFNGIYFKPYHSDACRESGDLLKYDPAAGEFKPAPDYPDFVCDGMGMARTRMKVLIEEYQFNNKVIFDTQQSMTIALVNLNSHEVFGYLTLPINHDHLVDNYLKPALVDKFGNPEKSGVVVWLRDWTKSKTVASSDPSKVFDRDKVQYYQRFPEFFDDWSLKVAFDESPAIKASKASLVKNLSVLGVAFFLLLGALIFMFITAQRERKLAQRQASFLANVTHELKTPLAVMQAAGENLADGRVYNRERLKSYGKHIFNEAVRLKRMIEKLLDVAKADANQSLIEPKPYQLEELVDEFIEDHKSFIESKGFTLQTDIERPLPPVMIDKDSFDTIVGNLVENSLKYYKDEKFIGISLRRENGYVTLSIEDHGIGIHKNFLHQIFEKFYRIEDALTAQTKGHGLGLSIVKNLVELNGGEIEVESTEGEGSLFVVRFPVLVQTEFENFSDDTEQQLNKEDSTEYA